MKWLRYHVVALTIIEMLCLPQQSSAFTSQPPTYLPNDPLKSASSSKIEDRGSPSKPNVVIVGGGVGGLAVAARMASTVPCHVTILEKNLEVGGRCGSFDTVLPNVGTFRHERGPSLLLLPDVYRDVFRECHTGSSSEDYGLSICQCTPAYQVIFEDGDSIELGFPRKDNEVMSTAEISSRERMNSYESGGAEKWDEYMKATSAFLDCGLPNFIEERLDIASFPAFLREALRDYAKAWPLKPHSEVLDAIFESEKMRALASFQDLYVGLEPYRNNELLGGGVLKSTAPAVFGLLAAIELHPSNSKSGVFAPKGGFRAVSNALEKLAKELRVEIECGKTVTQVQSDGVWICDTKEPDKHDFIPADLIVINADLPYATKSILPNDDQSPTRREEPKFDWDDSFSFSSGVISFHWSIDKPLEDLNSHNVFMVAGSRSQAQASWQVLRTNQANLDVDEPFNFYVHRASKTDPTAAPPGCDSIMVLVPCQTLLRDGEFAKLNRDEAMARYKEQFSEDVISRARQAVLKRLAAIDSLQDLEQHILDEVVDTPATWADQFNLAAGAPFALSHGFSQLSLTRPGPASSGIPNVLFCGASSRPGNGVPLVLIGAKQVAEKAVRMLAKDN